MAATLTLSIPAAECGKVASEAPVGGRGREIEGGERMHEVLHPQGLSSRMESPSASLPFAPPGEGVLN